MFNKDTTTTNLSWRTYVCIPPY